MEKKGDALKCGIAALIAGIAFMWLIALVLYPAIAGIPIPPQKTIPIYFDYQAVMLLVFLTAVMFASIFFALGYWIGKNA